MNLPKVVVTGLGATTPLGGDVKSTWSALLAGRSGVQRLDTDWAATLPVRIAAPAAEEPVPQLSRLRSRRLGRWERFAVVAAQEAWHDAGAPEVPPERLGVVAGTAMGGISATTAAYRVLEREGWEHVPPATIPRHMDNGAAACVGLELGARAGVHSTASACASGAEAIAYGVDMIRLGRADVVVAGGAEAPIEKLTIAGHASLRAMSTRNDEPERASRPFDQERDGFVMGEGGVMIVLESAEHASRRDAPVYAELAGVGYSADAHHMTLPDPAGAGAALAMTRALTDARVEPRQIVHVGAHATSTPAGDIAECRALKAALGEAAPSVAVSAVKSATGHLLGGAGALSCVAAILALRDRIAPPVLNLDTPDTAVDLDIVRNEPRPLPADRPLAALTSSFGFGGHNVVLLCRTP